MLIQSFPLLFSLILIVCAEVSASAPASSVARKSIVPVELGNRKSSMTLGAPQNIVIREQVAWAALWRERMASNSQKAPVPAVNFDRDMVVGIFLGGYPNSCYAIAIVSVEQEGEQTWVSYQVNPPAATDVCAQAIVYPLKLIAVPKKSGEVLFVDVSKK